jgi:hypothetical protein
MSKTKTVDPKNPQFLYKSNSIIELKWHVSIRLALTM